MKRSGQLYGGQPHQLGRAVDEIDACERRADERADPIERELVDLFRPVGGEKRMHDLAERHQLPRPKIGGARGAGERGHEAWVWARSTNMAG